MRQRFRSASKSWVWKSVRDGSPLGVLDVGRRGLGAGREQERVDPAGVALLLKFFEVEARFPRHGGEVLPAAVDYVALQVRVDPVEFAGYDWSGRSIKYHRAQADGCRRRPVRPVRAAGAAAAA